MTDVCPVTTSNERHSPLGLSEAETAAIMNQAAYRRVPQIPTPEPDAQTRQDWASLAEVAATIGGTAPIDVRPLLPTAEAIHGRALGRLEAAERELAHARTADDPQRQRVAAAVLVERERDEMAAHATLGRLRRVAEQRERVAARAERRQRFAAEATPTTAQGSAGR